MKRPRRQHRRLYNYGIGIHLLKLQGGAAEPGQAQAKAINPKSAHLSFQARPPGLLLRPPRFAAVFLLHQGGCPSKGSRPRAALPRL